MVFYTPQVPLSSSQSSGLLFRPPWNLNPSSYVSRFTYRTDSVKGRQETANEAQETDIISLRFGRDSDSLNISTSIQSSSTSHEEMIRTVNRHSNTERSENDISKVISQDARNLSQTNGLRKLLDHTLPTCQTHANLLTSATAQSFLKEVHNFRS